MVMALQLCYLSAKVAFFHCNLKLLDQQNKESLLLTRFFAWAENVQSKMLLSDIIWKQFYSLVQ